MCYNVCVMDCIDSECVTVSMIVVVLLTLIELERERDLKSSLSVIIFSL